MATESFTIKRKDVKRLAEKVTDVIRRVRLSEAKNPPRTRYEETVWNTIVAAQWERKTFFGGDIEVRVELRKVDNETINVEVRSNSDEGDRVFQSLRRGL
jgi:hypothetical protein